MKIIAVETNWTRIPFDMGGDARVAGGVGWQAMNTIWLRIVTDQGLEGWGEGFGHASAAATKTVLDTQLAPAVLGQDARDISGLRARLAKAFHLFGRNGPHVFALSALDIALWDIAGKAAGLPLWRLLGGAPRTLPAMPACCAMARRTWSSRPATGHGGAIAISSCTKSRSGGARRAGSDRPGGAADGGHQLPVDRSARQSMGPPDSSVRPDLAGGAGASPGDHTGLARVRPRPACRSPRARTPPGCTISARRSRPARRTSHSPASSRSAGPRRCWRSPRWPRRSACAWCRTTLISVPDIPGVAARQRRTRAGRAFERLFIDLEANPVARTGSGRERQVKVPTDPAWGAIPTRRC